MLQGKLVDKEKGALLSILYIYEIFALVNGRKWFIKAESLTFIIHTIVA